MTTLDELIDQCPPDDTVEDIVRYVQFARPEYTTPIMRQWLRGYIYRRIEAR